MKKSYYLTGLFLLAIILVISIYSQEQMALIDNDVFIDPQRSRSVFRHNKHNKDARIGKCSTCHHVYKNGKLNKNGNSIGFRCSDCHTLKPSGDTPGLMKAFHSRCKGCHIRKKIGPLLCGNCHKK